MLVSAHEQHARKLAAEPAIPTESAASCAVTQALWRFLAHEDVTLNAWAGPLRDYAHQNIAAGDGYVLAVIDWSKIISVSNIVICSMGATILREFNYAKF